MEIRKLTEKELPKVVKLHQYAYGSWTDQEIRDEEYNFMIPENIIGVFDEGKLQSVLTIMKVVQSVRGVLKGMGGISMVGTYPEARMKGYTSNLMQTAFQEMRAEGLSVSMLEPFRQSFYYRLGYVPSYVRLRLTAPLDALRVHSKIDFENDWQFDRMVGQEAKDHYMSFIQDFAPSRYHGFAYNPKIRDEEWKRRNKNQHYVFLKKRGKVEALARYQMKGFMHFEEEGHLIIHEMYWRNLEAQNALFYYFWKHRDQITKIQVQIPYGTNFQPWFEDLRDWIELRTWNPWMVRIIDVKTALEGLPAPHKGELLISLSDTQCKWNIGTYLLVSDGTNLHVKSSKESTKLKLTIHGISALIYGTASLEAIEYANWIEGVDRNSRQLLEHWFPQLPLYNPYNF